MKLEAVTRLASAALRALLLLHALEQPKRNILITVINQAVPANSARAELRGARSEHEVQANTKSPQKIVGSGALPAFC